MDLVNAPDQEIRGRLLQDHASRAQSHRAYNVPVVFGRSQHDNAGGELIEINLLENGEAVFIRHAQVEQKDIGFELGQHLNAIIPIGCLAHNGDVIIAIEELAQTFTEDGMIVSHQDANLLFCVLGHISRGTSTVKREPCPGVDSTVNTPPRLRVRSLIEMGPSLRRSNSSPVKRPAKLNPSPLSSTTRTT